MSQDIPENHQTNQRVCPKRNWVLNILGDEETVGESFELPIGLRLHLSHCEDCRQLADKLLAMNRSVAELGRVEPSVALVEQAERQAVWALRSGSTASHAASAQALELEEHHGFPPSEYPWWNRHKGWLAVAASVVLFLGSVGLMKLAAFRKLSTPPPLPTAENEHPRKNETHRIVSPESFRKTSPVPTYPGENEKGTPYTEVLLAGQPGQSDSSGVSSQPLRLRTLKRYDEIPSDNSQVVWRAFARPAPRKRNPTLIDLLGTIDKTETLLSIKPKSDHR